MAFRRHTSGMTSDMDMDMGGSSSSSSHDSMTMYTTASGHMVMSMQDMAMNFFNAYDTPLFSLDWVPTNGGQYAGTCIFLIVLAVIFRFILALRSNMSAVAAAAARRRETALLVKTAAESSDEDRASREAQHGPRSQARWTLNDALITASIDTTLAGVGYLL
jgi:hypothetical protein